MISSEVACFAGSSSPRRNRCLHSGRNQDYTLVSRLITPIVEYRLEVTQISPTIISERGPRHTNQPRAAIEEAVMNEVNVMIAELSRRCQLGTPNFLESFLATSEEAFQKSPAAALTPAQQAALRPYKGRYDELPRIRTQDRSP